MDLYQSHQKDLIKIEKSSEGKVNFFSDFTQLNYVKIVSYKFGGEN